MSPRETGSGEETCSCHRTDVDGRAQHGGLAAPGLQAPRSVSSAPVVPHLANVLGRPQEKRGSTGRTVRSWWGSPTLPAPLRTKPGPHRGRHRRRKDPHLPRACHPARLSRGTTLGRSYSIMFHENVGSYKERLLLRLCLQWPLFRRTSGQRDIHVTERTVLLSLSLLSSPVASGSGP